MKNVKRSVKIHISLTVLLLSMLVGNVRAQGVMTVGGSVVGDDGVAMQGVNVVAAKLSPMMGTRTDAAGLFQFKVPVDSVVALTVSYIGYATIDTVVRRHDVGSLVFTMRRSSQGLRTVHVSEGSTRRTTFTAINIERLESSVGPQAGVETLLKTLPDVSSNNELSSQYSVRGGSFDENLVYINDVELYRPMLIRNGQQEGTSIINPDMVDNILFSPGGFDATFGDRMASVLSISYNAPHPMVDTATQFRPTFAGRASASLLGASLSFESMVSRRFSLSVGLRHHSNRYLFRSLDTKGNYTTNYSDLQAAGIYTVSNSLDIKFLTLLSRNIYGLVPESQTTTFGGFAEAMRFDVYYEGEEIDAYKTRMAAITADYHPDDAFRLRWTTSFQSNRETEQYDILSQFMLYELNVGAIDENGETEAFDRGIGSFMEHARNKLSTNVFASELRGTHYAMLGDWNWGVKLQHEHFLDHVKEWRWVDSAGYAIPAVIPVPGVDSNGPSVPILQNFCRANHNVSSSRLTAFVQRNVDFYNSRGDMFSIVAGVRMHLYDIDFTADTMLLSGYSSSVAPAAVDHNRRLFVSPRLSFNFKPQWEKNILFRLAAGIYSQAPLYREYRYDDGTLNNAILPQRSYQAMGTMDWNFSIGSSPFKFTADVYYKYMDNLIPYRIENLRVRYDAENNAVGYATGLSFRLSGEVVEGLESWASLSLMRTRQDVEGDDFGWIARPTDQTVSFKMFFQDYVPSLPFWRMSLNLIAGTGFPFTYPTQTDFSRTYRYPAYFRVDWGNTLRLSQFQRIKDSRLMRHIDEILLSLEVFNLFDYKNVVSHTWVADYNNQYYPVPNYLTARQLNLKITVLF